MATGAGKRTLSLKNKLVIGGVASVLIPFIIAGSIIYVQLSTSLLDVTKGISLNIAQEISSSINEAVNQEIRLAMSIAADPVILNAAKTDQFEDAETKIKAIYNRIGKKYHTIFLLNKFGTITADSTFPLKIGLDLAERVYYQQARKGLAGVDGPVLTKGDTTLGLIIIVVYAPIMDHDGFYGVVCLPFNMNYLLEITKKKKIGRTGFAQIINRDGLVVAHPEKERILSLSVISQARSEEMQRLVRGRTDGTASHRFDGKDMIVGLSFTKWNGWIAVFTQDKDEIMYPMNRILYSILIWGLFFLLVTILTIVFFSERISAPIQKMMDLRKQVTDHSTELILQIGLDKTISFANPAYAKATGLKPEQIIGMAPCLDNDRNIPPEEIWGLLESGLSWSGRIALNASNPTPIVMDAMLLPLRDESGATTGYLQLGRDVTADLTAEKRLQQSQKLEAVGTLAGGIAHDFNNILSAIFGYTELSLMHIQSNEVAKKYLEQIIIASERARELVCQILTFSRNTDVELSPLSPKAVLNETLILLRASIHSKIDIQSRFDSDAMIMAEPSQLSQVAINLFMNAAHAIGKNTGWILLELETLFVDDDFVKSHPDCKTGKHIRIRISDSGGGMKPKVLEQIFEPFFTTKPKGQGTGLGLSVVHGIVNSLGGIISATSELGKGTVFDILIPCTEKEPFASERQTPILHRGTERIAFIDDEEIITTSMPFILENLGYRVTAFTDSADALQTILKNPDAFDLIITDYSMPQMTGVDIAEQLRAQDVTIPIILASGYFEKDTEDSARCAGISELVQKPLNAYQLTDAIQRVIQTHKPD